MKMPKRVKVVHMGDWFAATTVRGRILFTRKTEQEVRAYLAELGVRGDDVAELCSPGTFTRNMLAQLHTLDRKAGK